MKVVVNLRNLLLPHYQMYDDLIDLGCELLINPKGGDVHSGLQAGVRVR